MNEFQKATERLEGIIKKDCNRNTNPTLLLNLKALYDTFAADPSQKKDIMKVEFCAKKILWKITYIGLFE